jgi:hypothetical protein
VAAKNGRRILPNSFEGLHQVGTAAAGSFSRMRQPAEPPADPLAFQARLSSQFSLRRSFERKLLLAFPNATSIVGTRVIHP